MASKLHGVEVELEVIRRKGDVIELPVDDVVNATTNNTASRRLERTATTSRTNRPSTSDQVFEETAAAAPLSHSKCDGNMINLDRFVIIRSVCCIGLLDFIGEEGEGLS